MSVGDKVLICSLMQWLASASLQCLLEDCWATDTLPVCSHTTVMMPEPIHTIIKESMKESIMFADFLIINHCKVKHFFSNNLNFAHFFNSFSDIFPCA